MSDLSWVLPLRHDLLTPIFIAFSELGGETGSLAVIAFGYWSFNKKLFRDVAILALITTLFNMALKSFFIIPRPTIEYLVQLDDIYSFPSGHAQMATVLWITLAAYYKRFVMWWFSGFMIVGTCLSRIYVGVHFPTDVIAGFIIGLFTVFAYISYKKTSYWKIFGDNKYYVAAVFFILIITYLLAMMNNLNKSNIIGSGAILGLILGHIMEHKYVNFTIHPSTGFRILLGIFGVVTAFLVRTSLKYLSPAPDHQLFYFFSYALLTFYIAYIFPYIFQKIGILRTQKEEPTSLLS